MPSVYNVSHLFELKSIHLLLSFSVQSSSSFAEAKKFTSRPNQRPTYQGSVILLFYNKKQVKYYGHFFTFFVLEATVVVVVAVAVMPNHISFHLILTRTQYLSSTSVSCLSQNRNCRKFLDSVTKAATIFDGRSTAGSAGRCSKFTKSAQVIILMENVATFKAVQTG